MQKTADLFIEKYQVKDINLIPLPERCRPNTFEAVIGHDKYFGKDAVLRKQIETGTFPSLIIWGPPGVGKTTLAKVIASESNLPFSMLSAVTSGKSDLKSVIEKSLLEIAQNKKHHILFIDEIHRYNKAQQDGLLHAVENGTIKLIGATTENPSFEVIAPLLSRCQVIKLEPLNDDCLKKIVYQAIEKDPILSKSKIKIPGIAALIHYGAGDARRVLNILESCLAQVSESDDVHVLTESLIKDTVQHHALLYDKQGDYHYDLISAFIKSVRGSDPDAAVYYLARMLEGGEDPVFIARRLIILASEDIGNAEPYALSLANAGLQSVHAIGMPEARIVLAQVATYLACCAKSNAAYLAIDKAINEVKAHPALAVPMQLRNAPTKLMKELNYGKNYRYPHDFPNHFIEDTYLPEKIKDKIFYEPTLSGREKILKERIDQLWAKRNNKKRKK